MAEIVATFNTVSKEFTVTKDGQVIDNVEYASFGRAYDGKKFGCSIDIMEKDDENDMREMRRMVASQDGSLVSEKDNSGTTKAAFANLLKRK